MHRNMGSSKFEVQIKFSFRENVTSGHFIDLTIQKWLQDPNFHHIFKIYILSLKWANNFNPYKQYTPWKVKISRLSNTLRYKYMYKIEDVVCFL